MKSSTCYMCTCIPLYNACVLMHCLFLSLIPCSCTDTCTQGFQRSRLGWPWIHIGAHAFGCMDSYFRLQQLCNNCKTQPKFGFCIQFDILMVTVTSDLPWTPSCIGLPVEPTLFAFSKMAHGKELWECSLTLLKF